MTRLPILLAAALVALPVAAPALDAQPPSTWRLVQVGRDRVPMTVSTGEDGRPLLRLVEETLTIGPGDRVTRVTVMRADVYERTPCALLAQLRAAERARAAGDTTRPAPPRDTTAAMCADLRASRDTTAGRVLAEGGQRWVVFTPAPGRSTEPRARLVARGDTLDLEVDAVVMRYVRMAR
jgi:hypothetical protein